MTDELITPPFWKSPTSTMANPRDRVASLARHLSQNKQGSSQENGSKTSQDEAIRCEDGCGLKLNSCAAKNVPKMSVEKQPSIMPKRR